VGRPCRERYSRAVWRNWAGDQSCEPAAVERPASTAEVVDAVAHATAAGRHVRAAGSGHSFTGAALTDGTLVLPHRLDRVLDADRATGLVRVQAGITLHALSEALAGLGLALENLGDIDAQTLAGALVTGTHGTGATLRNLSANVTAMQLVTAAGEVRELDGGELLRAARVSVGARGIVTEITLRCVPAFTLRGVDAPLPFDEVLATLDERAAAHRHFELYVFPHARTALTRTNDVVDEPPRPRGRAAAYAQDVLLTNHALHAVCLAGRAVPRAIPALNRFVTWAAGSTERVDRSDRIFASPRLVRFSEMEYALPRAALADALPAIKAQAERHPVNFPIEVRFVAGDDALLSPASGRDTAYVAVHAFRGMPWEPYFRAVEAIADAHGGRPHWAKRHFPAACSRTPTPTGCSGLPPRSRRLRARPPVVRDEPVPAAAVALAALGAERAEALPAAVHDRHRRAVPRRLGRERDLDLGGVGAVEAQVPQVGKSARRLPGDDLAPVVLGAVGRALVDAPARARLERHGQVGVRGDRVAVRPPQRGARGPHVERALRRAADGEAQLERLHQRSSVFSAASRKRAAASPHTCSR
jgi:FAD-linked oxidoreductase